MYEILEKTDPAFAKTQFVNPDIYGQKLANKEGAKTINELTPERRAAVEVKAGKIAVTVRNTLLYLARIDTCGNLSGNINVS